jgi:hypothetical protein
MNFDKHKNIYDNLWSFVFFFSTLMPINAHEFPMNYFRQTDVNTFVL